MKHNSSNTGIISNLIWKFSERMLAQIVTFTVSIILARLLLPGDYGVIAMVLVFISIADVLVTSGLGDALIQKKDADNVDFSSVFYFNIGVSIVLYLVLFFIAPYVANYYDYEILTPVLRIMSLRLIIAGISIAQQAYVSKHMMFKRFFWSTLFGTVLSAVVGIWMAYNGFGVWALVAQYMIYSVVNTLVLWITVNWRPELKYSWPRIVSLLKYGWKILFEALSNTIDTQIRNLVIGKVYSAGDLGYYTKAQQFPSLLITNISSSISAVLFPAMSLHQDDKAQLLTMLRKAVVLSTYLLFPMLAGLAIIAEPLVSVLLTDKWIACVPLMQIFCLTYAATIGMIPRHQALNATGRSDVYMYEHMFARIVGLILLLCVFRISVMAIAVSSIAGTIILAITVMYTSKKYNNYLYKDQIVDVLPIIGLCTCMGVPVYFIQYINMSDLRVLCIQIVSGIMIYAGLSVIFKPNGYRLTLQYLVPLFKKFRRKEYDV